MATFSIQVEVSVVCGSARKMQLLPSLLLLALFFLSMAIADSSGISPKAMAWVVDRYGASAKSRILEWQDLIARNQGLDEQSQLELVNDFFNQVRYSTDDEIWGKTDYWATPVEMLSINAADCEDYSIAKYFTLREMGMPIEKLRITYVKSLELNQAHMVLAYYERPDAEPLVLDNLTDRIEVASQRQDLVPVYSFNGDGLWLAKSRGRGRRVGNSGRISLWQDLIAKMASEVE
ncbi:MAG: transglutaminase-like cysteine peptidase [Candidatus Polarisedimenticolaceae bacterium]|nr:transglutaminase-like cysteine peptidase [Candidatus Polarisedimenticolaceae bacterium]